MFEKLRSDEDIACRKLTVINLSTDPRKFKFETLNSEEAQRQKCAGSQSFEFQEKIREDLDLT